MSLLAYIQSEKGIIGDSYRLNLKTREVEMSAYKKETLKEIILGTGRTFCEGSVERNYVRQAIRRNTMIFILFDESDVMKGFLLATPLDKDRVYLDVICAAKGFGSTLLREFIQAMGSYGEIILSALTSVLAYYPQFGFEHRHDCVRPASLTMPPEMITGIKNKDPFWLSRIPEFQMFLRDNGFVVQTDPDCHNPSLSYEQFMEKGCDASGFEMRKCIKQFPGPSMETRKAYRNRQTRAWQEARLTRKNNNRK
jgi:hypothetical protein